MRAGRPALCVGPTKLQFFIDLAYRAGDKRSGATGQKADASFGAAQRFVLGNRMSEILEQRPNHASRNFDEMSVLMRAGDYDIDLAPRDWGAFDFVSNVAYMPNSYLGYIRYGPAAQVVVPGGRKRDDYFIHLPAHGKCATENRVGNFVCKRGLGVISSPAGHVMRSEAGSGRITLSFTKSALVGQLTALLGDQPRAPLEFAPAIDLSSPNGRRFTRQVRFLITDLDDAAVGHNAVLHAAYEQLIMTGLLLCQPHTHTAALERLEGRAAPCSVKRAINYMEDRLEGSVMFREIVAASGVPGRTLLKHFHDHRGTTPMRYLRDARLARVREELLRAEADDSVTRIATGCGVQHLGRFAVAYRERFGESPSATLRKARSRSMAARPSAARRKKD
jgi:AraC-like DNA-binding protein